jgi:hypothetical protein
VDEDFVAALAVCFGVGAAEWADLGCASEEEGFCGASVRRALGIASIGEDFGEAAGSPTGVSWPEEGGAATMVGLGRGAAAKAGLFFASEAEGFALAVKMGGEVGAATMAGFGLCSLPPLMKRAL